VEKESSLSEQINRMRRSATRAILERRDVVVDAEIQFRGSDRDDQSHPTGADREDRPPRRPGPKSRRVPCRS
jgi:hypothetical protein